MPLHPEQVVFFEPFYVKLSGPYLQGLEKNMNKMEFDVFFDFA